MESELGLGVGGAQGASCMSMWRAATLSDCGLCVDLPCAGGILYGYGIDGIPTDTGTTVPCVVRGGARERGAGRERGREAGPPAGVTVHYT